MKKEIMNEIIEAHDKYIQLRKLRFFEDVIFSYQWWILVFIIIVLWLIWAIFVDKTRLNTILIVGFMTSMIAVVLDDIGLSFTLWDYPYQLVHFTSRLSSVDMAVIPIAYMLLYQYFHRWKYYFAMLTLFSLFASFVAEPVFVKLDMYMMIQWKHWYSTPVYILIGIFVKWIVDKIDKHSSR